MPRVRLDVDALRVAKIALDAPLCLRPLAWGSDVELLEEAPEPPEMTEDGIALVQVHGPLSEEADQLCGWYDGYLGKGGIVDRFEQAITHPACRAVLMHFRTPGGTSAGILEGVERMLLARAAANKPVIGFVKECCSAGLWIAASICDGGLYGREDAEVGSIGSYVPHESIAGMLTQEGIAIDLIADPPGKVAGNGYQPLDELGRARIERGVKQCTARFIAAVSQGRPALTEEVIRALNGDILQGFDAVSAGLLDGVADFETTLSLASALADQRAAEVA
jgi:ClpP class serine protease